MNVLLKKLLLRRSGKGHIWTALTALCIGMSLLFIAVLIWWNFNQLLHGRQSGDSLGSTFLTISKKVSNDNMGHPDLTVFKPDEINALADVAGVQAVGDLVAVQEQVYMKMQLGTGNGFSTILFLEAIPDAFMDKLPPDWHWRPGQTQVPVILSAEFLSLYNYVFAPSQGLPQLSEATIRALPFQLEIGSNGRQETFVAHIAGFSDRITSVLVPEDFASYINGRSGRTKTASSSRLVLKVADPSDKAFTRFLEEHDYVTNTELLRWSRLRAVAEAVAGATGALAVLLVAVSLIVFTLFIELTVANARASVQLLLELGYQPAQLRSFLQRRFLPMMLCALLVASIIGNCVQVAAGIYSQRAGMALSYMPGWPMWAALALCLIVLTLQTQYAIRKALRRL